PSTGRAGTSNDVREVARRSRALGVGCLGGVPRVRIAVSCTTIRATRGALTPSSTVVQGTADASHGGKRSCGGIPDASHGDKRSCGAFRMPRIETNGPAGHGGCLALRQTVLRG